MMTSSDIFNDAVRSAMKLKDLSQDELYARLGYSRRTLVDHFSAEKQCEIEFLLDAPATDLWNITDGKDKLALEQARCSFEHRFRSDEYISWAQRFPVRELQSLGFIRKSDGMSFTQKFRSGLLPREIMKFLGVASVDGWKKRYAIAQNSVNPYAYSAWIRLGELQVKTPAKEIFLYRGIIANNLKFLRRNSEPLRQSLRNSVVETLEKCDIRVLQVPAFISAPAPRSTVFWKGQQPIIQLSTAPMSDSSFLEAVYHAVGHILQEHTKRPCLMLPAAAKCATNPQSSDDNRYCAEASRIAESLLMTEAEECEIICCGQFAKKECVDFFARKFQIRPGIIVSRLQQQNKIPAKSPLNAFKVAV